jgi:hypothetical protein
MTKEVGSNGTYFLLFFVYKCYLIIVGFGLQSSFYLSSGIPRE